MFGKMLVSLCIWSLMCVSFGSSWSSVVWERAHIFSVESTVLVNAAERSDGARGQRLRARLELEPASALAPGEPLLLRFILTKPQLFLTGKLTDDVDFIYTKSIWDELSHSTFYALWKDGAIETAYLDPTEPLDVLNYKKSLISLFQLKDSEGTFNETDISGDCQVVYESLATNSIRKIKRDCTWEGEEDKEKGEEVELRRVTRYELGVEGDGLGGLHAEEVVVVRAGSVRGANGVKARAWHRLTGGAEAGDGASGGRERPLALALGALGALEARTLPLEAPALPLEATPPLQELIELVQAEAEALSGAKGGGAAAHAALRALAALGGAPRDTWQALLAVPELREARAALCRLAGAAGSVDALEAVGRALQLRGDASVALAHEYLSALALAAPEPATVRGALRLAAEARVPAVADAALLAAAAGAATCRPPDASLRADARAHIERALRNCKDDACLMVKLHALGNLRDPGTVETVLAFAENGTRRVALGALEALGVLLAAGAGRGEGGRLARVALRAGRAGDVRAAALALAARHAHPVHVARVACATGRALSEIRRVALPLVPEAQAAMLVDWARGWDARAARAGSGALERDTGWRAGDWALRLGALRWARGPLLRRAVVSLRVLAPDAPDLDVLSVEIWTQGLESLTGAASSSRGEECSEGREEEEEEEASAGLGYSVGGVRVLGATLFRGQGELLAHVWAGAGSEPTPVLRALRPLWHVRARRPLLVGVPLRVQARALGALALDAQAQVSLWARTAHTQLELRTGVAVYTEAALQGGWSALRAEGRGSAEGRLRVSADLDFYDGVALCVRARTSRWQQEHQVALAIAGGVRRVRERVSRPGRTLGLDRTNDMTCRTLGAAPSDEDPDES